MFRQAHLAYSEQLAMTECNGMNLTQDQQIRKFQIEYGDPQTSDNANEENNMNSSRNSILIGIIHSKLAYCSRLTATPTNQGLRKSLQNIA